MQAPADHDTVVHMLNTDHDTVVHMHNTDHDTGSHMQCKGLHTYLIQGWSGSAPRGNSVMTGFDV